MLLNYYVIYHVHRIECLILINMTYHPFPGLYARILSIVSETINWFTGS